MPYYQLLLKGKASKVFKTLRAMKGIRGSFAKGE